MSLPQSQTLPTLFKPAVIHDNRHYVCSENILLRTRSELHKRDKRMITTT